MITVVWPFGKTQQIHEMETIFTQNNSFFTMDHFEWIFLSENLLRFAKSLQSNDYCLSLTQNSQSESKVSQFYRKIKP